MCRKMRCEAGVWTPSLAMPKLVRGRNRRRFWLRSVGHFESGDGSLGSTGRREKGMNVFGFDRGAGSGMILTLIMRPCMLNATNGAKNATISAASRRPMIITLPLPFTPAMAEANLSQAPMLSERVANFSFPSQIYPPCPPFPHNQSIPRRNAQRKGGGQSQSESIGLALRCEAQLCRVCRLIGALEGRMAARWLPCCFGGGGTGVYEEGNESAINAAATQSRGGQQSDQQQQQPATVRLKCLS